MGSASAQDYLNSYLLLAMIIGAVLGICVYNPAINLPLLYIICAYRCKGKYFLSVSNPVQP